MSPPAPPNPPTDKNKAWGAAGGTAVGGGVLATVAWQIVGMFYPDFKPTSEMITLSTAVLSIVGAWVGAWLTKHNMPV